MPESSARLWAQASHDLCQPVQGALLLSTLLGHACEQSEYKQTVQRLESALHGLQERLDHLALLARLEAGLQSVEFQSCPIDEVLDPVLRDMTAIASDMGKTVTSRLREGAVQCEPNLLRTLMGSLVLNALRLDSSGKVLVSCRRRGAQFRIVISYKGSSMAKQTNTFIEVPNRSNSVSVHLGLGLPLVQQLCLSLGYTLRHGPMADGGQRLVVELPAAHSIAAT